MLILILDADGVFMNEMPYWKTALATALDHHDLAVSDDRRWSLLGDACLLEAGVHRITKKRGCNSNWDFAAVMARALDDDFTRRKFADLVGKDGFATAASLLSGSMEALWTGQIDGQAPLSGFGIDRHGELFEEVVAGFQAIFRNERTIGWQYERHELAGHPERMRALLNDLRQSGWRLAVCTSRKRDETIPPMTRFGIAKHFDRSRIVTHDDVVEAQRRTGITPLSKPHWFPLAAVVLGLEGAIEAVRRDECPPPPDNVGRLIYVGDAPADFRAATTCVARGLPVEYIHVDSGVSDEAVLRDIRQSPLTRSVEADLFAVRDLLNGTMP